jgi:hypothetical protein
MPSVIRLSRRVVTTLFYTTLFAANTAFSVELKPRQVLVRDLAVPLSKISCQNVFLEEEQGTDKTKPRFPGSHIERV